MNTTYLDGPQRAALENRIIEGIDRLDDSTLMALQSWLERPVSGKEQPADSDKKGVTRRQALTGALFGGAAVVGAGIAGNYIGESGILDESAQRIEELNGIVNQWQDRAGYLGEQLDNATGLINMFDNLEGIGLDDVVNAGIAAVAGTLGNASELAQALREGVIVGRNNLNQLDQGLALLDGVLTSAENTVTYLSQLLQGLEDGLREAGEPIAPVTDALGSFFTKLVERIPVVGPQIIEAIDRVKVVIGAIPESVQNINRDVIEPLRRTFFPRDGSGNIQVRLLEPLTALIFAPIENLLGGLASLADTWERQLQQPAQQKIEARAKLMGEIQRYRQDKQL